MVKVALTCPDERMPQTLFYREFCQSLRNYPGFSEDPGGADLLLPVEDTAMETNWPRYGSASSCIVRGSHNLDQHKAYLARLALTEKPLCLLNMIPYFRAPLEMANHKNVIVADINLVAWERAVNPRTISMPALPAIIGTFDPDAKCVVASFRGVDSHPCRAALAKIGDGRNLVVDLVSPQNHVGRIDVSAGKTDPVYVNLLNASIFAFVPRGDAEFSYRLLEAMSFGCIPVLLSDGLVLPFDRTINWDGFCLRVPEQRIPFLPAMLAAIPPARVEQMQAEVERVYRTYLCGLTEIVGTLLSELSMLVHGEPRCSTPPAANPLARRILQEYATQFEA